MQWSVELKRNLKQDLLWGNVLIVWWRRCTWIDRLVVAWFDGIICARGFDAKSSRRNKWWKENLDPSFHCTMLSVEIHNIFYMYMIHPNLYIFRCDFFYNVSTRAGQCIALETIQPSGIIHNSPPFAFIHFEDKCEFVKYANVKKKNTQWRRDKFKGEDDSWFQSKER